MGSNFKGSGNIYYQSEEIERFYRTHRTTWDQFYASEKNIISGIGLSAVSKVLDIGCGCGGLGLALREQFRVESYTGVEINQLAANVGRSMNPKANILNGDILDFAQNELHGKLFDTVFSLSCVDWNIRFSDMLVAAWSHVLPGGHLVSTFRLTVDEGCNDIEQSYQYINFNGILEGEIASYVVLNARSLVQQLAGFNPSKIDAYGYWGTPSATVVTPNARLCFAAFSIQKRKTNDLDATRFQLNLPAEILDSIGLTIQADK